MSTTLINLHGWMIQKYRCKDLSGWCLSHNIVAICKAPNTTLPEFAEYSDFIKIPSITDGMRIQFTARKLIGNNIDDRLQHCTHLASRLHLLTLQNSRSHSGLCVDYTTSSAVKGNHWTIRVCHDPVLLTFDD